MTKISVLEMALVTFVIEMNYIINIIFPNIP